MHHEHIVRIYNFDSDGRWTYIHMEWLEGMALDDWLDNWLDKHDSGLPLAQIQPYLQALSSALTHATAKTLSTATSSPAIFFSARMGALC